MPQRVTVLLRRQHQQCHQKIHCMHQTCEICLFQAHAAAMAALNAHFSPRQATQLSNSVGIRGSIAGDQGNSASSSSFGQQLGQQFSGASSSRCAPPNPISAPNEETRRPKRLPVLTWHVRGFTIGVHPIERTRDTWHLVQLFRVDKDGFQANHKQNKPLQTCNNRNVNIVITYQTSRIF